MARMIEHWGMVKQVDDGRATVVVETTACGVCGHGGHCGIGRTADGRRATLLSLPAVGGLKVGDFVNVGLPESKLSLAAMFGYMFPALATLAGALVGLSSGGNDAVIALGAAAGFAGSLVVARIALALSPGFSPAPQLISHSQLSATFPKEHYHD
jgi:sigma-E factor negative regulatory protein RseC